MRGKGHVPASPACITDGISLPGELPFRFLISDRGLRHGGCMGAMSLEKPREARKVEHRPSRRGPPVLTWASADLMTEEEEAQESSASPFAGLPARCCSGASCPRVLTILAGKRACRHRLHCQRQHCPVLYYPNDRVLSSLFPIWAARFHQPCQSSLRTRCY